MQDSFGYGAKLTSEPPEYTVKFTGGYLATTCIYTPYEGPNSSTQNGRKLGVFGRKLEESHSNVVLLLFWYILYKTKLKCWN